MKLRKPASAFLAAAMLASSTAVVSYAAEDEAMKKALTVVKERIDVSDDFSEFDHSVSTDFGQKVYDFNWRNPEQRQYLNVTVSGKVITEYRYNDYSVSSEDDKRYTFAKLTKEELAAKAREHIEMLNPTVASYIVIHEDQIRVSLYSNTATVPIGRVKDGVKVAGQNGSLRLDKNTGELLSYQMNWTPGAGFRSAGEAISKTEAIAGYQAEFPITKLYVAKYDWETKEYTPHLVYRRTEIGQIDAFTGKKATFENSYDYYESNITGAEDFDVEEDDGDDDDVGVDGNPANGVSFTEEEIKKLEAAGQLIKPEKALADMIASGIWSIPAEAEVSTSDTYYDSGQKAYLIRVTIRAYEEKKVSIDGGETVEKPAESALRSVYAGSFTMNAETGELLAFSGTDVRSAPRKLPTEKYAKSLLERYLKQIAGEKAEEFRVENPTYYYVGRDRQGNLTEDSYLNTVSVTSPRYAYGIPCDREKLTITVDNSGRVSRYELTWLGLEYPEPEKILTEEEAYRKYFGQIEYELLYRVAYNREKKRVETALVYNASDQLWIDAFSGALTYSDGTEIPRKTKRSYTDLERSGYRDIAEKLELYGVTLMDEEGRLNADMTITRKDFADLVRCIGVYGSPEGGEKPLTRKYAAKILAGYEAIAEIPGLFRSPYSDVSEDDKYVGCIALATVQGYMKGENGRFCPSAKMTRGDALKLVYDYLSR